MGMARRRERWWPWRIRPRSTGSLVAPLSPIIAVGRHRRRLIVSGGSACTVYTVHAEPPETIRRRRCLPTAIIGDRGATRLPVLRGRILHGHHLSLRRAIPIATMPSRALPPLRLSSSSSRPPSRRPEASPRPPRRVPASWNPSGSVSAGVPNPGFGRRRGG